MHTNHRRKTKQKNYFTWVSKCACKQEMWRAYKSKVRTAVRLGQDPDKITPPLRAVEHVIRWY